MSALQKIETGYYRVPLPEILTDSMHGIMRDFELITARVHDALPSMRAHGLLVLAIASLMLCQLIHSGLADASTGRVLATRTAQPDRSEGASSPLPLASIRPPRN